MVDIVIITEILGWLAFAFSITACLCKNGFTIISFQVPSSLFWSIHMALMGAIGGALMSGIALFRNIFGLCANERQNLFIFLGFIPVAIISTAIFSEGPVAFIVVLANTIMGAQIVFKSNARMVRLCNGTSKLLWLGYGIISGSLPIVALALTTLLSLGITTYRHDPFFVSLREESDLKRQSAAAE